MHAYMNFSKKKQRRAYENIGDLNHWIILPKNDVQIGLLKSTQFWSKTLAG